MDDLTLLILVGLFLSVMIFAVAFTLSINPGFDIPEGEDQ